MPEVSPPQPLRRRRSPAPPSPSPWPRRLLNYAVAFATAVLVIDSLIGSNGLMETLRARRQYAALAADLSQKQAENAQLRDEIRRLREDPTTIEAVARQELGLMRADELLVVVRDEKKKD